MTTIQRTKTDRQERDTRIDNALRGLIGRTPRKTERQKTAARLDSLFRELIRLRAMKLAGGCQRCLSPKKGYKDLDTGHCHGRGKRTVRWDPRNAAGICGGCHRYIDAQITAKESLFRKLLGDDYDRLYILANMTSKQSPIDYKLVEIYLKEEIRRLNGHE